MYVTQRLVSIMCLRYKELLDLINNNRIFAMGVLTIFEKLTHFFNALEVDLLEQLLQKGSAFQ